MKIDNLKNMTRGWFVGDFKPNVFNSSEVEVAVQRYEKGQTELPHYHKISHEITLVISGKIKMNETILLKDEIALVEPNEIISFEALEKSTTVVVKLPSAKSDKYVV